MIDKASFNGLRYFYCVATQQSVTCAADQLCVTQSAVSKQIATLEAHLGQPLFVRQNRKLTLTAQGQRLFACCQPLFTQLERCLDTLTAPRHNRPLVVSCEPTLLMYWLIPRLADFTQQHQDIEVALLAGGGPVDFIQQHIDVALRRNDFAWGAHTQSHKMADEVMLLLGKSAQHHTHVSANASTSDTLLLSASRPRYDQQGQQSPTLRDLPYRKHTYLQHFYLCLQACLSGLGDTVASVYMCQHALDNGTLSALSKPIPDGSAYYLLAPTPLESDPRAHAFARWLQGAMLATQSQVLNQLNADH